ncbi:hypothetical protein F5887DRAFT_1178369 [Amanita rubescens]|nr:hypothetical protein F5887DRAFT_1178369 [Amanita rubescens]
MQENITPMNQQTLPAPNQAIESPSQPADIRSAYPYLKTALSFLFATTLGLYRILYNFVFKIAKPVILLSPLPIILYILSPVFTFCNVLFDMLVLMPFRMAAYLLDALYPLYVFCGVACITGCLLGLGGRYLSDLLVKMTKDSVPASKGLEINKTEEDTTENWSEKDLEL